MRDESTALTPSKDRSATGFVARHVKRFLTEATILYRILRDPRTPRQAKLAAGFILVYAFSPLDLVPDPTLIGLLDDLVLVPLGLAGVRRLAPADVVTDAEAGAREEGAEEKRLRRVVIVVAVAWLASLALVGGLIWWVAT